MHVCVMVCVCCLLCGPSCGTCCQHLQASRACYVTTGSLPLSVFWIGMECVQHEGTAHRAPKQRDYCCCYMTGFFNRAKYFFTTHLLCVEVTYYMWYIFNIDIQYSFGVCTRVEHNNSSSSSRYMGILFERYQK